MNRLLVLGLLIYWSVNVNGQIVLSNTLVLEGINKRIDSVHVKIFKAIQIGILPIFDFDNKPLNPSNALSNCNSTADNICDSTKAKVSTFREINFKYQRGLDYHSFNLSQKIVAIDLLYQIFFHGVELDLPTYHLKITDLEKVLSERDMHFLKLLGASYCQNVYFPYNDTITFANGHKTFGAHAQSLEDFDDEEVQGIKESLNNNFQFDIRYDSFVLKRISKVLLYQFSEQQFKNESIQFYSDKSLNKKVSQDELCSQLFRITYGTEESELEKRALAHPGGYADTGYMFVEDNVYISRLTLFEGYCKIDFSIYSEKELNNIPKGLKNKPFQTYYIPSRDLESITGRFQYEFLKNLFNFK